MNFQLKFCLFPVVLPFFAISEVKAETNEHIQDIIFLGVNMNENFAAKLKNCQSYKTKTSMPFNIFWPGKISTNVVTIKGLEYSNCVIETSAISKPYPSFKTGTKHNGTTYSIPSGLAAYAGHLFSLMLSDNKTEQELTDFYSSHCKTNIPYPNVDMAISKCIEHYFDVWNKPHIDSIQNRLSNFADTDKSNCEKLKQRIENLILTKKLKHNVGVTTEIRENLMSSCTIKYNSNKIISAEFNLKDLSEIPNRYKLPPKFW